MAISCACRNKQNPEEHLRCTGYVQKKQPKQIVPCTCPCHIREEYALKDGTTIIGIGCDISKVPKPTRRRKH